MQLQATLVATLEIESTDSGDDFSSTIREHVAQSASFDRLDLISVDRDALHCEVVCTAVAVLSRPESVRRLLSEIDEALDATHLHLTAAMQADRLGDFSQAYRATHTHLASIASDLARISVLAQEPPPQLVQLRRDLQLLRAERARRMGDVRISVRVVDTLARELPALQTSVEQLVAMSGARVDAPGACVDQWLQFDGAVACHRGPIGPQCSAAITYSLGNCAAQLPHGAAVFPTCARSVHPSHEDGARARLNSAVRTTAFQACVADGLATHLALLP